MNRVSAGKICLTKRILEHDIVYGLPVLAGNLLGRLRAGQYQGFQFFIGKPYQPADNYQSKQNVIPPFIFRNSAQAPGRKEKECITIFLVAGQSYCKYKNLQQTDFLFICIQLLQQKTDCFAEQGMKNIRIHIT